MEKALNVLKKIPLSVSLIANALNAGKKQCQIATMCNVSEPAVSDYISRYSEEINMLIDKSDSVLSLQYKLNAVKAAKKLDNVLNSEMTKKDMIPLTAVVDRMTHNYRLLSGASTQNIAFASFVKEVESNTKVALIEASKRSRTVKKIDTSTE